MSERVSAFAAGEPDDELAAHLQGCAECRAELDDARRVLRSLGELAAPARSAERAEGELFWADLARGARQLHDAAKARRARQRWIAPAIGLVAVAAALALFVGLRTHRHGDAASRQPPAPAPVAPAPADESTTAIDLAATPSDPAGQAESLDDDQLDAALARLDAHAQPAPPPPATLDDGAEDVDPLDTVETLDDDALDRVYDALVHRKGA
jgi:predicted anti-sigma-YlaC factor YlaD